MAGSASWIIWCMEGCVTFGHSGGTDNPVFKHEALCLRCSKNHGSALVKLFTTQLKLSILKLALFPQPRRGRSLYIVFGIKEVLVADLWYYCSLESKADTPDMDDGEMVRDIGSSVFVSVAAVSERLSLGFYPAAVKGMQAGLCLVWTTWENPFHPGIL